MVKVKIDMQDDSQFNQNTLPNNDSAPGQPPVVPGGQKIVQPTPELQSQQTQSPQPAVSVDTLQQGISASQMGWDQSPNKKSFDVKKLIIKGGAGLVVLGVIFAVLVFTNIIALSQFKTVNYTNSSGTHYSLTFYSKHTTKTLKSGNTELVSKVSQGDKYPITLAITSGPTGNLDKNGIKTCSGPLPKVFDVQNSNLNQQISVCSFPATDGGPVGVYVMGFASNNQAHIVTISQDLSGVDLSSQSGAQQSLPKFGLDPYQDDIKTIVSSIKVE